MIPNNSGDVSRSPHRIRTLVADDELLARELISRMVQRNSDLELVGTAASGAEALCAIERLTPQLVLLDIQMPNLDGFSVAEQLAGLDNIPYIIFVTAHDEFALRAFDVAVRDYLVKPVNKSRFASAIHRAKVAIDSVSAQRTQSIVVQCGATIKSLMPDEVVWVSAANQYVCIHSLEKHEYTMSQTLRQFSLKLPASTFIRIHRSTLINKHHVVNVSKHKGAYSVTLTDGSQHSIARSRKSLLTELLSAAKSHS